MMPKSGKMSKQANADDATEDNRMEVEELEEKKSSSSTRPTVESAPVTAVAPNPGPAPAPLPSAATASNADSSGDNIESEVNTRADVETSIVLDTNEPVMSLPRPPREERLPGAFHSADGRNARDVVILDEDTVIISSEPDAPAPVEEVSATLVDQDEEARKRQEQIDKEVERKLAEQRDNAEVADIVTGFWCTPKARRLTALGVSLVVVLALVAIVLGTVLPRAQEPAPPTIMPPTAAPTSPLPALIQLLSSVSFDDGAALETPSTPQNDALNWLANNNTNLELYSDDKKIQRYVLVTLYYSTSGDAWENNDDWLSDNDECGWNNVFCSNGAVAELDLWSNNLVGTIPAELALLSSSVDEVNFGNNELTGTIPSEIALMTKLDRLDLYKNALTGTIPSEIGLSTNLGTLLLDGNALTGSIPYQVGFLTNLNYVRLSSNALTGMIPSEIALMTNLNYLSLINNAFTGDFTCPDFIEDCYISCNDYVYLQDQDLNSTCRSL